MGLSAAGAGASGAGAAEAWYDTHVPATEDASDDADQHASIDDHAAHAPWCLPPGFGTRMRPLTDRSAEAAGEVAGKPLIDHVLDRLAEAGVERAVVNVHYLADQIEQHLRRARRSRRSSSPTSATSCSTPAAAWCKALPLLGDAPFFLLNSDTLWIDGVKPNLARLADAFDPATHGRAAAAGADHRQHRLCRPRRFSHGRRTAA